MEPDQIVQGGIRTLQQKIGGLLQGLDPKKYGGEDADAYDGPRSPNMNIDGGGTAYGGFTSYGGGGGTAYGGGGTAYGGDQTSYGGGGTAYGGGSYGGSWQ